jgi:hypothetical protein
MMDRMQRFGGPLMTVTLVAMACLPAQAQVSSPNIEALQSSKESCCLLTYSGSADSFLSFCDILAGIHDVPKQGISHSPTEVSSNLSQIENDIKAIVGGQFSEDSLGPTEHSKISSRARIRASQYLDVFEAMFLGLNFDATAQSNLYLPAFLELLHGQAPERVASIGRRLLTQYDAVMVIYDKVQDRKLLAKILPDDTVHLLIRIEARRARLHMIAK